MPLNSLLEMDIVQLAQHAIDAHQPRFNKRVALVGHFPFILGFARQLASYG
jgi:hypothetical protein